MPAQFDHVECGIYFVGVMELTAVLFLRWLQWRSRLTDLGVNRVPCVPTARTMWGLGWLLFIVLTMPNPPRAGQFHQRASLMLAMSAVFGACLILLSRREAREEPELEAHAVSHGLLRSRVEALASKAGTLSLNEWSSRVVIFSLYVLPAGFRAWTVTQNGRNVLLLRHFLEQMSRAEIDALVARQLARQQRRYYLPPVLAVFACSLVAVGALEWLGMGLRDRWLVLLLLLAMEVSALWLFSSHALHSADVRAIKLTGSAEPLISAIAELSRESDSKLDLGMIERLARKTGVTSDRLQNLIKEQPRPAEDRYILSSD